jgi:hypothetical protein
MRSWKSRLGLSFIVTLSLSVHRLPAQAPLVPPSQPFDYSPSAPLGRILDRPTVPQPPPRHPWLQSQGFCCGSDLGWYGCGGLKSLTDFYFGSCRTFFGEPCVAPQRRHTQEPGVVD